MKRLAVVAAISSCFLLFGAKSALAVPLACDFAPPGECQITTLHDLGAGGAVEVDRALHIIGPLGQLKVNGGATLNLTIAGNGASPSDGLIMDSGGKITGNTTGTTGVGATLNITVTSGNILLEDSGTAITADNTAGGGCGSGHGGVINLVANGSGANINTGPGTRISVNGSSCPAGAINITASAFSAIDIDGSVLSQSSQSGSGTGPTGGPPANGGNQKPGGGPIFITAACDLTVSDTGVVSSRGQDSGADLVHLVGGCNVVINGLVESTGGGHVAPGNPPNSCSDVLPFGSSVRRNLATRPGKPSNSTACVEVWAGNSLVINKAATGHVGEINADTAGGFPTESWIDLFARGDIKILNSSTKWAVHANGNAGTDDGGVVTVKSAGTGPVPASPGNIYLTGLALQASAASHGQGGKVDVESMFNVDLRALDGNPDGKIQAKGGGGAPADHGGNIVILAQQNIRAGGGSNLNVAGHPNLSAEDGTILLQACAGFAIEFPPGTTSAGALVTQTNVCPAPVTFESYVLLPACPCQPGVCPT